MSLSFTKFSARRLLLLLALLTAGCDAPMPNLDLKPEVNKLFASLQAQDFDTALTFYSDEFYKGIPREAWKMHLQKFIEVVGPIESFKIRKSQSDTRFSGKFFIYQLETVHKGGKKARHIVTYVLPVDGGDVKLVGHKISAKGFE